ncbi:MAG: hypothetical protein ACM3SR_01830 [Ignavibacteriales bacterium]
MSIVDQIRERQRARKKELSATLNLEQNLGMRLSELGKRDIALKIYSEVLVCEIWLCGTEQMAAQLRQDDPEVTVYTANEMRRLMSLNPDPEELMNIHMAKSVFPKSKIVYSRLKNQSNKQEEY